MVACLICSAAAQFAGANRTEGENRALARTLRRLIKRSGEKEVDRISAVALPIGCLLSALETVVANRAAAGQEASSATFRNRRLLAEADRLQFVSSVRRLVRKLPLGPPRRANSGPKSLPSATSPMRRIIHREIGENSFSSALVISFGLRGKGMPHSASRLPTITARKARS